MGGDFGFWDLQYSMRRAALVETCFSSLGRMVAFQVKRPWLGCCLQYSSSATRAIWIISPVKRPCVDQSDQLPAYQIVEDAGKIQRTAVEAARRKFTPEFMNRIDKTVVFKTLRDEHLSQILDIELGMV